MNSFTETQLACLTSPLRSEIYIGLKMNGPLTVNQIAEAVGCSPESLYHHIRGMARVGLIEVQEIRPAGTQKEAVYRLTHPDIGLLQDGDAAYAAQRAGYVSATLRKADRDYKKATKAAQTDSTLAEFLFARRVNSRLDKGAMDELKRRLDDLTAWMIGRDDPQGGTRVSLHTVASPIVKQRRPSRIGS